MRHFVIYSFHTNTFTRTHTHTRVYIQCKAMVESDISRRNSFYCAWSLVYSKQLWEAGDRVQHANYFSHHIKTIAIVIEHPTPNAWIHKASAWADSFHCITANEVDRYYRMMTFWYRKALRITVPITNSCYVECATWAKKISTPQSDNTWVWRRLITNNLTENYFGQFHWTVKKISLRITGLLGGEFLLQKGQLQPHVLTSSRNVFKRQRKPEADKNIYPTTTPTINTSLSLH